jgi:hypothetical protein
VTDDYDYDTAARQAQADYEERKHREIELQNLKQQIENAHAVLDESGEKTLAERVRLLVEARDLLKRLYGL